MHSSRRYEREVFRFVENELYAYPWITREIANARTNIIEGSSERSSAEGVGEGWGNPTLTKAFRLLNSRRLKRLIENYEAITRVLGRLGEHERQLVKLKYWERRLSDHGICQQLHISRRTLYNWREKVLRNTAEELGLL